MIGEQPELTAESLVSEPVSVYSLFHRIIPESLVGERVSVCSIFHKIITDSLAGESGVTAKLMTGNS